MPGSAGVPAFFYFLLLIPTADALIYNGRVTHMTLHAWQWVVALLGALIFFVVFAAGYGVWTYVHPKRMVTRITPKDIGLEYERVTMKTRDGIALSGWFVPAQAGSEHAIILLHGYPADKGDILASMAFLADAYHLLLLDFRALGGSEGRISTVGVRESEDVRAGVVWLKERGVARIGVWGFSMGAAAALMALPSTPDIQAIVSDTSYARLDLMAEEVYREVPLLAPLIGRLMRLTAKLFLSIDIKEQSPERAAAHTTVPVLFIHAHDDDVTPFSHVLRLQRASATNPHAQFWFRARVQHGSIGDQEYQQRVREFLSSHLSNQP